MIRRVLFKSFFPGRLDRGGFSYLEVLIATMLLAVFFVPTMDMFSRSVSHLAYVSEMNTALSLAREGMERIRNLGLSEAQLISRGDVYEPPVGEKPFELDHIRWRILQQIRKETDPLRVDVFVYKDEEFDEPLVHLTTLIEDIG